MLKHIWSVLCRDSVIQQGNVLSLRDVLEGVNIDLQSGGPKALPINIPLTYEIVTYLEKTGTEEESLELKITLMRPDQTVANEIVQHVTVPAHNDGFRQMSKFQGFMVDMPGKYYFVVSYKLHGHSEFEHATDLPLRLNVNPAED